MSHGVTYHGGFQVNDHVEVRLNGAWRRDYIVQCFLKPLSVQVKCSDCAYKVIVPLDDIRHPHLAKEVQRGSRA